jgi:uncharacterized CHY-type Zn-finger protein
MMNSVYSFHADYLMCPQCVELLTREDIEGFGHCPYCNYRFDFDRELEDFLLKPVVRQWIRHSQSVEEDEQRP